MKLRVLDQIHVSAVSADTLTPGQTVEVNDVIGAELLKKHAGSFEEVAGNPKKVGPDEAGDEKQADDPMNKAAPAHADKAAPKPKAKAKG